MNTEGEVKAIESLRISVEIQRSKLMYTYIREDKRSLIVPKYGSREIEFLDLLGTEIDSADSCIAKLWVFKRCKELIGDSCKTEFKITRKMKVRVDLITLMKEVRIKGSDQDVVYELC